MFTRMSSEGGLARCSACGAVVDASDEGRRIHLSWHRALDHTVIDLVALESLESVSA
jgi:hypothetical protein